MHDGSTIVKQRQLAMRREMDRRGIALKIVAADSGIPYSTLASYFPADAHADPAQIPGGAIYELCDKKALPADILSMLTPNGWHLVRGPEEIDHDEIADLALNYCETKMRAHHPDSPGGPAISDCERADLDVKVIQLRGRVA